MEMDLDNAIATLGIACKHWRLQCENNKGKRWHSVTVWADGKRFTVNRRVPIDAVNAALKRIGDNRKGKASGPGPKLKLAE